MQKLKPQNKIIVGTKTLKDVGRFLPGKNLNLCLILVPFISPIKVRFFCACFISIFEFLGHVGGSGHSILEQAGEAAEIAEVRSGARSSGEFSTVRSPIRYSSDVDARVLEVMCLFILSGGYEEGEGGCNQALDRDQGDGIARI